MKRLFILALVFLLQSNIGFAQNNSVTLIEFEERELDLGDVKHGDVITTSYKFTNVSQETVHFDLVSSCECTETNWPRKPIAPGESGEIKIIFDSSKKEESEVVDVDVYLLNEDPKTGNSIAEYLTYKYNLIKD